RHGVYRWCMCAAPAAGAEEDAADDGASDGTSALGDGVVVTERGVDYAWSRPTSPQALRSAGYTFVARYLSYDTTGKNLSAGEAQGLFAAGIDVVANWEW